MPNHTLNCINCFYNNLCRYEVSLTGENNLNGNKKDDKVGFTATQLNEKTFYRFLVSRTGSSDMCPGPVISLPVMTRRCTGMCYLVIITRYFLLNYGSIISHVIITYKQQFIFFSPKVCWRNKLCR